MHAEAGGQPRNEGGVVPPHAYRVRAWPHPHDIILVLCCRTGYENTHAGIVFRGADGRWMLFHQAWQETTLYEPLAEGLVDTSTRGFAFVVVEYPQAILKNLLRLCRTVADRPLSIPFAFGLDDRARWDDATGALHMPHGRGLTCVNFVLLFFASHGLTVVDRTGWPLRGDDAEAQRKMLADLERWCRRRSATGELSDAHRAHLEAVHAEIDSGCVRVRPEELAGSFLHAPPSVRHDAAIPAGVFVSRAVDALATAAAR